METKKKPMKFGFRSTDVSDKKNSRHLHKEYAHLRSQSIKTEQTTDLKVEHNL